MIGFQTLRVMCSYLVSEFVDYDGIAEEHHCQRKQESKGKDERAGCLLRNNAPVSAPRHAGSLDDIGGHKSHGHHKPRLSDPVERDSAEHKTLLNSELQNVQSNCMLANCLSLLRSCDLVVSLYYGFETTGDAEYA